MELTSGSFLCSASVLWYWLLGFATALLLQHKQLQNSISVQQLIRLFHLMLREISTYYSDVTFPENQMKQAYINVRSIPLSGIKHVSFGILRRNYISNSIHPVRFIAAKSPSEFRTTSDIPHRPVLLYVHHPRTPA